jgi:RNA-splicing ligase RtcB
VAWLPVLAIEQTGQTRAVYDVVTGEHAACFLANGIVVHNCGNKAVRTNLLTEDVLPHIAGIMDQVYQRISFGIGRANDERTDHPSLDQINAADFSPQRQLYDLAAKQLGTVGSGNHYVDIFAGDDGHVWIGVHFGSRGFGHKAASGFRAMAQGKQFGEYAVEGEHSPPVLLPVGSEVGQAYIAAMNLAAAYAFAGRDVAVDTVVGILGGDATYTVHNNHNFSWFEEHYGEPVWMVRKGCTPAFPGQQGFVGATMGENSVILEGVDSPDSAVHGAGRVMSRPRRRSNAWQTASSAPTTRCSRSARCASASTSARREPAERAEGAADGDESALRDPSRPAPPGTAPHGGAPSG